MSSVQDCHRPPCCPVIPPVNVPGSPGASAFTFTTASFVVPSPGSDVVVQVLNTAGLVVGQTVVTTGPANWTIASINGPTTLTLAFQNQTGDVSSGTIIPSGSEVVPSGQSGPAGTNGENGYALTTSSFVVPSIGNTVVVPVNNSGCFVVGQDVIATGPANFVVTAIPNATSVTIQFVGNPTDVTPGTTIVSGSTITAAGAQGSNAYTTLTAQLTVPAVGSTVTASVVSNKWMVVGQIVVMPGPATFSVTSLSGSTSAVLTNLGYINNLQPGSFITNGSGVSPGGQQSPNAGSNSSSYSSGTAYTLTATPAQMVFGTTTPSLTIPSAGKWIIFATSVINFNQASATSGQVSTLLRSSTQGPLAASQVNQSFTMNGDSSNDGVAPILFVYTTTTVGDTIQLWGSQTNASGATFQTVSQAALIAYQIG